MKVVNSNPSNGKPMDITAYIVDPRERKVFYKYRKTEGELHGFPIEHEGEYQLCLSNKWVPGRSLN